MRLPVGAGWVERRVVLFFRADPEVLARLLPPPFRPRLVHGWGVAGFALERLRRVKPRALPVLLDAAAEHASHHILVEWEGPDGRCEGAYVPRRYASRAFSLVGGRLLSGLRRRARIQVREWPEGVSLSVRSRDERLRLALRAGLARSLPPGSIFASVAEAAEFSRRPQVGRAVRGRPVHLEGPELRPVTWSVEALRPELLESSFFEDRSLFPEGTIAFDSALLIRGSPRAASRRGPLALVPPLPGLSTS